MTFFHRPVGLVELLILYARVQFYMPQASDYHLISKTDNTLKYQADPGEILAGLSSGANIIHKNTKLILGRSRQDYILITNPNKPI